MEPVKRLIWNLLTAPSRKQFLQKKSTLGV